ncbi:hypothetical protein BU16DRAFT_529311 [Lophium mytilinum]|uniref:Pentatricopeptide repeat domain-containing protein n=1 Tax=Lophium mytilinum TaxID=390894 RepID=A0A6A6QKV5_9PEZI|nr:hypothetical protein BU16DRAFT_529311 [Lophium mytilinum]
MPPALDRLLASPSALRVLKALVENPSLPAGYFTPTECCLRIASRTRNRSSHAATKALEHGSEERRAAEDCKGQSSPFQQTKLSASKKEPRHTTAIGKTDSVIGDAGSCTVRIRQYKLSGTKEKARDGSASWAKKSVQTVANPRKVRTPGCRYIKPVEGWKATAVASIENVSASWAEFDRQSDVSHPLPTESLTEDLESSDQDVTDADKGTKVGSSATLSTRPRRIQLKVDTPEYRLDFDYWVQLLQFQERARGLEGVREIWNGMRAREIDLPTTGSTAPVLWETFVKDFDIVEEVITYASGLKMRTGLEYAGLYASCVGHWLPLKAVAAYKFHKSLVEKLAPKKRSLCDVLPRLAKTARTGHFDILRKIYLENSERDIYDTFIPTLYQRDKTRAQEWHNFLVVHKDLPSRSLAGSPMVEELSVYRSISLQQTPARNRSRDELVMPPDSIIDRFSPDRLRGAQSQKPVFNREIMSRLLGESHHVKPKKEFDDSFCARLFATRAFSPASVIKGLGMFGIEAIGPLALREMGLRTHPLNEMPLRFKELKEAGVTIGRSVFSKAVEKFTAQNRLDLVRELLESDQHPDVLEDTKLQEELLFFFISKEDWKQVHRTLAILTIFHANPNAESWNLMLRAHSKNTSGSGVDRILKDMHANGVEVSHLSLNHLHANILRRRNPSKRPVYRYGDRFDDLRFIARIWLRILQNGGRIEPWRWREILRRFGMTGRIRELRRLVLWLAAWYSPRKANQTLSAFSLPTASARAPYFVPLSVPPSHATHPYQKLFPSSFQEALIEWGFKSGLAHNPKRERTISLRKGMHLPAKVKPIRWTDGLEILVELREQGVFVTDSTVKKAIQTRIVILYGPNVSNRKENRVARKNNPWMWQDMIRRAEEVWGKRLFQWPGREEEESEGGERSQQIGKKVEIIKKNREKTKRNDGSFGSEWVLESQRRGMEELRALLRK